MKNRRLSLPCSGTAARQIRVEELKDRPGRILPNLRAAIDSNIPDKRVVITLLSIKVTDDLFPGPHALAFSFTANDQFQRYPATSTMLFPQNAIVNLPAGFCLTADVDAGEHLTIRVSTNLRFVIRKHPRTGEFLPSEPRSVQVMNTFTAANNFGAGIHTVTSSNDDGQFQLTYRVVVFNLRSFVFGLVAALL